MNTSTSVDIVEVHHSLWRPSCEDRAFVLHAIGIPSQTAWNGRAWSLYVAADHELEARSQLRRYERENPPRSRPAPPEPLHRRAWLGSLGYAAVVLLVGFLAGSSALNQDWFEAGSLRAAPVRSGELWRAVTALTLHLDVGHLLSNLGFGTVFGLLAGQLLGPGVAWASVLAAAAGANLLNAYVQPELHASVGASTAVFATLGLLAAYAWRQRSGAGGQRAHRWAPIFAGVFLLAFTGAGGENTDVLAHLTGFATGAVAGVLHATWRVPRGTVAQILAGSFALALVAASWALALANA
ncbi:MAG: rhomboid family intramembrane serine protease [Gammaproteobacteria bacterium]|nr:rhomboid family intramembrane serine protease [Gammaproteobacteria bacterium]